MSSVRACLDKVKYAESMARLKIIFLCHSQDLDAFVFRRLRLYGIPTTPATESVAVLSKDRKNPYQIFHCFTLLRDFTASSLAFHTNALESPT
jgi:hypothetical protein